MSDKWKIRKAKSLPGTWVIRDPDGGPVGFYRSYREAVNDLPRVARWRSWWQVATSRAHNRLRGDL